ncbi:hypothetical protein SAMN05421595_1385 [Austwickia chelonae]|nr:hypothetical protein SAMN05421595_1385 [Austwickia chelonae]
MRRSIVSAVAIITASLSLAGCIPASIITPPPDIASSSPTATPTPKAVDLLASAFSKAQAAKYVHIVGDQSMTASSSLVDSRGTLDNNQFDTKLESARQGEFHVISISGSTWVKPVDFSAILTLDIPQENVGKWIKSPNSWAEKSLHFSTKTILSAAVSSFPAQETQRNRLAVETVTHKEKKAWKITRPTAVEKVAAIISADGKDQLLALERDGRTLNFSDWNNARPVTPPAANEVTAI